MKLNKKDTIYLFIIIGVCLLLFFLRLGSTTLFDVDEPRYAEAAREMIESNNWITPYFNYVVRFDKPIFFYWLIAICYKLFGISEFAARFPSAVMAMLTALTVYFFGRKHINSNYGVISSLILITSLEFIGLSRMSITDMTLSAFISFMLLSAFTASESNEPYKKYWWYLFYIFMGYGTLTKGPIVPALAVIIMAPYLVFTGKFIETLKTCKLFTGTFVFMLVTVPWYSLVILENGRAYIDQFFLIDNFKRFTGTVSGHKAPIYFFFIVILVGFIPWCTYIPYAIYKHIKPIIDAYKNKTKNDDNLSKNLISKLKYMYKNLITPISTRYITASITERVSLFSFLWFIIIFIFFSISGTKLVTYVLPLFPALALIVGKLWHDYIYEKDNNLKKPMLISTIALFVILFIVSLLIVFEFNSLMPRDAKLLNLSNIRIYVAALLSLMSLLSVIFVYKNKRVLSFASIIVMILLLVIMVLYYILPQVNYSAQGHLNRIIKVINTYPDKYNMIICCGMIKPSIVFYTKRHIEVVEVKEHEMLKAYFSAPQRLFVITRVKFLDELSKNLNFYCIDIGNKFALITNKPFDKPIVKNILQGNNK